MSNVKSADRVYGLDVVRAIAILMVVAAHYFASTFLGFGGTLGVELFFVLSGFLIGGILIKVFQKNGTSFRTLKEFWIRRWFRTVPNYVFFLILFGLMAVKKGSETTWLLYPVFLQNFAWPMGGFFEISWSLAVEEWFYLSFPLVLWLMVRRGGFKPRTLVSITLVFLAFPVLLRFIAAPDHDILELRKIVVFRVDSMMYGVGAAAIKMFAPAFWKKLANAGVFLLGIGLIAGGAYWFQIDSMSAKLFSMPMMSFGAALVIPGIELVKPIFPPIAKVVTFISTVSYSAYLLHMPLFFLWESIFTSYPSPSVKIAARLVLMILAFLTSWLPYRVIELPFLSMRDRFSRSQAVPAAVVDLTVQ